MSPAPTNIMNFSKSKKNKNRMNRRSHHFHSIYCDNKTMRMQQQGVTTTTAMMMMMTTTWPSKPFFVFACAFEHLKVIQSRPKKTRALERNIISICCCCTLLSTTLHILHVAVTNGTEREYARARAYSFQCLLRLVFSAPLFSKVFKSISSSS